jgi:hypothetical protein
VNSLESERKPVQSNAAPGRGGAWESAAAAMVAVNLVLLIPALMVIGLAWEAWGKTGRDELIGGMVLGFCGAALGVTAGLVSLLLATSKRIRGSLRWALLGSGLLAALGNIAGLMACMEASPQGWR